MELLPYVSDTVGSSQHRFSAAQLRDAVTMTGRCELVPINISRRGRSGYFLTAYHWGSDTNLILRPTLKMAHTMSGALDDMAQLSEIEPFYVDAVYCEVEIKTATDEDTISRLTGNKQFETTTERIAALVAEIHEGLEVYKHEMRFGPR